MSRFICAVSTSASSDTPVAFTLTEQTVRDGDEASGYSVRALGRFGDDDPVEAIQDLLADEEQYTGHVTVVVMGGQRMAERFGKAGLSVVPVQLGGSAG